MVRSPRTRTPRWSQGASVRSWSTPRYPHGLGSADAEQHGELDAALSADRTVREYTERHYLPGAATYRERAADKCAVGRQLVDWQHAMEKDWPALRFGEMKVETNGEEPAVEVQVYLNDLDRNEARVELYADGVNSDGPVRQEMEYLGQLAGAAGGYLFRARVPATRPATDYTVRVIPHAAGVAVPLEVARILWQR